VTRAALTLLTAAATSLSLAVIPSAAHAAPASTPATTPATIPHPSAAAVGKLTPSGCTRVGTDDQCDLYAMEGTTQLLGTTIPIWGFSTSSTAGTATAPGPSLVVMEGDTVTVTLHNQLGQDVSLALPGQPASSITQGLSSAAQTTGAAPGGTATYSFHATRPGTFLYEAGHTANGARQVAMGLAGALVVLAADGTAAGQTYDDESVVVLSDLDPRLNADPSGFDMRRYRARWRLLNGKPFPSTTPIATDQGHTVLLRYVDAGSVPHPMSLLGANQLVVAQDAHPFTHPVRSVVAEVDSGTTVDALVTMPSGPDSRVTLFETGSHLDNVGQTELDPTRVATGGILTFLDTNAPLPIDDLVGPVPSHVTVTPSVSAGLAPAEVAADLSDVKTGGSNLTAAEFVVDDADIAVGQGIPMQPDVPYSSPTAHVTGTIPVSGGSCTPETGPVPVTLECLSAGKHIIYVRGQDAANNWGVVGSVVFNLPKTGPATRNGSTTPSPANGRTAISVSATGDDSDADGVIDQAELFLDAVGANGSGLPMTLNRSATVVSEDVDIPAALASGQTCQTTPVVAACMAEGTHHVFVHSHDSLGLWGPVLDVAFVVDRTGPSVDAAAVSPNPSNGLLSAPGNPGYLRVSALITDRDGISGALQGKLTRAEGFFAPSSADPAPGTGFSLLPIDGTYDSVSENVYGLIPLSQVRAKPNGTYQVYVRGRDDAGNWGELFAVALVIDKTAPVLGTLTGTPNPTGTATQLTLSAPVTGDTSFQAAEIWTGTTDPGVGKGTRVTVGYVGGNVVVTVPLAPYPPGATRFNLRVQDMAGNWSNAVNTTVTISATAGSLLSDNFESGNLNLWSSTTGTPSVSTTAGLFPNDGVNRGLLVPLPGSSYVTDNSPASETAYHARFAFSGTAMRVASGNATAVTVFEARTASGSVYRIDVGRLATGTGPVTRIRVVMWRSGAGTVTGPWVNLSNAAHVLQTDWLSGPATGPGQGSLRLSVDGSVVSTLTGNTSTLRVESVRLGTVVGVANSATGAAYFDSFVSSRTALP
jgi:FtsP/CotA-like multicopper oxidase with cupredoxin domain